jgi:AcrR family transcriptional regulator
MTAVAERSNSSIGALYNYFPDKQSIAFNLLKQYAEDLEAQSTPFMKHAQTLTHVEFADLFIDLRTQFAQQRPAYLKLLAAPNPLPSRPRRSKGVTHRHRECLPNKESIALARPVCTRCARLP